MKTKRWFGAARDFGSSLLFSQIGLGVLAQFIVLPLGLVGMTIFDHYARPLAPGWQTAFSLISLYAAIFSGIAAAVLIERCGMKVGLQFWNDDSSVRHYDRDYRAVLCQTGYSVRQIVCRKLVRWVYCVGGSLVLGFWLYGLMPEWMHSFRSFDLAACSMAALLPVSFLLPLAALLFPSWARWMRVRTAAIPVAAS